jgi:hypothetical protein
VRRVVENRRHFIEHLRLNHETRKRKNGEAIATITAQAVVRSGGGDRVDWERQAGAAHAAVDVMEQLKANLFEKIEICSAYAWNFLALLPPYHAAKVRKTPCRPRSWASFSLL